MNPVLPSRFYVLRAVARLALITILLLITVAVAKDPQATPIAYFTDIAEKAGLTVANVFGGKDTKKYIIETTGTGLAIFDYDNDGWPDIFLVNGTTLEGFPPGSVPTNHLYRNNHDGTFTDVTVQAGLVAAGWGQGVCVGDYDNDGWEDLYVTYYGKNRLYRNQQGVFTEVADVTDVAVAKLDGTAKGGIVFAIARELNLPIRYVGTGEKLTDLAEFDARQFVGALFT